MKNFGASREAAPSLGIDKGAGIDRKLVAGAVTPAFREEFKRLSENDQWQCLRVLTIWARKHPGEKVSSLKDLPLPPPTPAHLIKPTGSEALRSRTEVVRNESPDRVMNVEFADDNGRQVIIAMTGRAIRRFDALKRTSPELHLKFWRKMLEMVRQDPKVIIDDLPLDSADDRAKQRPERVKTAALPKVVNAKGKESSPTKGAKIRPGSVADRLAARSRVTSRDEDNEPTRILGDDTEVSGIDKSSPLAAAMKDYLTQRAREEKTKQERAGE